MRRFVGSFALCAVLASSAAYAADLAAGSQQYPSAREMPSGATPFRWTGLYFGAEAGAGWPQGTFGDTFCDGVSPGHCTDNLGRPGTYIAHINSGSFVGGVYVGYNQQLGNGFVFGVETGLDFGENYKGPFLFDANNGRTHFNPGSQGDIDFKFSGSARLKAGFAVGRWLPYVDGGVAFAQYNASAKDPTNNFYQGSTLTGSGNLVGATIGGGMDYAITNNFLLGVDYRFTDYGKDNVRITSAKIAPNNSEFLTSLKTQEILLRASLKY